MTKTIKESLQLLDSQVNQVDMLIGYLETLICKESKN